MNVIGNIIKGTNVDKSIDEMKVKFQKVDIAYIESTTREEWGNYLNDSYPFEAGSEGYFIFADFFNSI